MKALGRGFSAVPFKTFSISRRATMGASDKFEDLDYKVRQTNFFQMNTLEY